MVSVSKLCCPVCWELITLLRVAGPTESQKFDIRGCHPHIYPLVLPPWISDEIRNTMDARFLHYLGIELRQLMATHDPAKPVRAVAQAVAPGEAQAGRDGKKHRRNHSDCSTFSQESATTLSSISSNSEGEYEDGDSYYPVGAANQSSFGSHMTGAYKAWKKVNA